MTETEFTGASLEDVAAGKDEIASAGEVLQAMLKTARAFRIYLPNNPQRQRFIDEASGKATEHLRRYGQFRLDVGQFELFYAGKKIHENRDPKESLPFRMYSDGIRCLGLFEGIGTDEICQLLDIVGQDRPADTDDDIVTLLWMKDLPHVYHLLAEDFLDSGAGAAFSPTPGPQEEGIRRAFAAPPAPAPGFRPRIEPLTPREVEVLRQDRDAELSRNPLQDVLGVLSSILAGESDEGVFGAFLEIAGNVIANQIHAGRAGEALRLIRFLEKMAASDRVPAGKRELIRAAAGKNLTAETIFALAPLIDAPAELPAEDLADLLRFFGPRHLGALCELLAQVQKMKMRKLIIAALVQIGQESPRDFFPFLADQRWYLVRNVVFILNLIGAPEGIEAVTPLHAHSDARVRKEAFTFLQKFAEPRARMALMKYFQDPSLPLRLRALQVLAAAKFAPALKAVEEMAAAKDFAERDIKERVAICEALGELAGDRAVPGFQRVLRKRSWFGRGENEAMICAIAGLKKAGTAAAVQVLEEARKEKKGELEVLIARALKEIEARAGVGKAGPGQ